MLKFNRVIFYSRGKVMKTEWDDSNWREEYKAFTSDKKQLKLLEDGPKSLSQSWLLHALYQRWMKIKGYSFPEPASCQSSFKEFNGKIK